MIIKNIQSENFLKYKNLNLDKLTEKGIFAVSGQNESGKTSIGETLCFALFGRTFTLDLSAPQKLIRWGESRCSIGLTFSDNKDNLYRIDRYLDDEGTYGAKLSQDDNDVVLAKGVDEVNTRIQDIIGFGYDEFIESFYLAQRELTTPHPHSQTIKVMAGIAPLSNVRKEIAAPVDDHIRQLDKSGIDLSEARRAYKKLEIDDSWMPELNTSLEDTESQIQALRSLNLALEKNSGSYIRTQPLIQKKKKSISMWRFSGLLFLLIAIASWVMWALLIQQPEISTSKNTGEWLTSILPGWEQYKQWLLPGAVSASVLFFVNWLINSGNRKKLVSLKEEADGFNQVLQQVQDLPEPAEQPQRIVEMMLHHNAETEEQVDAETVTNIPLENILSSSAVYSVNPEEASSVSTQLIDNQTNKIDALSNQRLIHEFAIRKEQKRLDEGSEYTDIMTKLETGIVEQTHKLEVRKTAVELLESAGHHLSHKFNQSILKLAGGALPSFTQDRYKHLKIDENMDVRVFSSEKGDFLDFDEISSGTQRQVMLSLRLAMSQELINAIECAPQFIFLDEPFAFFDQERIRDTIAALPAFSEDIAQIWLVAQEYPEGIEADLKIQCERDKVTLST